MGAVSAAVDLGLVDQAKAEPRSLARAETKRSDKEPAEGFESLRTVLLQLAMCGAVVDRNSIELARGIAEILIWSAEHARAAARNRPTVELPECGALPAENWSPAISIFAGTAKREGTLIFANQRQLDISDD
jgi:hypothetical protein